MLTGGDAGGRLRQVLGRWDVVGGGPALRNLAEITQACRETQCMEDWEAVIGMALEGHVGGQVWDVVARLDCFVAIADCVIEACVRRLSRPIKRSEAGSFEEHMACVRPAIHASLGTMLAPVPVQEFIASRVEARLKGEYISVRAARLFDDILDYPDQMGSLRELHTAISGSPGMLDLVWSRFEESYGDRSVGPLLTHAYSQSTPEITARGH